MRTNKTLYGFMAFGPLGIILAGFFLLFAALASTGMLNDGPMPDAAAVSMLGFLGLMMVGAILSLVSMIMYIVHISKNKAIPEDQRIFWILGMVLANGITNIIYFFVYITKEDPNAPLPNQQPKSEWD
jgi:hypothetical protein